MLILWSMDRETGVKSEWREMVMQVLLVLMLLLVEERLVVQGLHQQQESVRRMAEEWTRRRHDPVSRCPGHEWRVVAGGGDQAGDKSDCRPSFRPALDS